MLDAFIIEQLKQEKEKEDVQPLPLTLELPNRDDKEEERKKRREEGLPAGTDFGDALLTPLPICCWELAILI